MKIERAVDRYHREILEDVRTYTVLGYTPGGPAGGWVRYDQIERFSEAKWLAEKIMYENPSMRTSLVYAADRHQRHVMVGSYDRKLRYKEVEN